MFSTLLVFSEWFLVMSFELGRKTSQNDASKDEIIPKLKKEERDSKYGDFKDGFTELSEKISQNQLIDPNSSVYERFKAFTNFSDNSFFVLLTNSYHIGFGQCTGFLSKCVADLIKGKTAEEIRHTFNIKNDFNPEEEEQLKKENSWSEDL